MLVKALKNANQAYRKSVRYIALHHVLRIVHFFARCGNLTKLRLSGKVFAVKPRGYMLELDLLGVFWSGSDFEQSVESQIE